MEWNGEIKNIINMEIWKAVKGYEGKFLASSKGRIMNVYGNEPKQHLNSDGDVIVTLKGKDYQLAKIIASLFCHRESANHQSLVYIDGDKSNISPDNLRWEYGQPTNAYIGTLIGTPSRTVYAVKDGNIIEYKSINQASKATATQTGTITKQINNPSIYSNTYDGYSFAATMEQAESISKWQTNPVPDLEGEEWKPITWIKDIAPYYMVSNKGRVKSEGRYYERLVSLVPTQKGYLQAQLYNPETHLTHPYKLSRLVATAFIPNPNNYEEVDHVNADKMNNTTDNLEWVSHEENVRRAVEMGKHPSSTRRG